MLLNFISFWSPLVHQLLNHLQNPLQSLVWPWLFELRSQRHQTASPPPIIYWLLFLLWVVDIVHHKLAVNQLLYQPLHFPFPIPRVNTLLMSNPWLQTVKYFVTEHSNYPNSHPIPLVEAHAIVCLQTRIVFMLPRKLRKTFNDFLRFFLACSQSDSVLIKISTKQLKTFKNCQRAKISCSPTFYLPSIINPSSDPNKANNNFPRSSLMKVFSADSCSFSLELLSCRVINLFRLRFGRELKDCEQ